MVISIYPDLDNPTLICVNDNGAIYKFTREEFKISKYGPNPSINPVIPMPEPIKPLDAIPTLLEQARWFEMYRVYWLVPSLLDIGKKQGDFLQVTSESADTMRVHFVQGNLGYKISYMPDFSMTNADYERHKRWTQSPSTPFAKYYKWGDIYNIINLDYRYDSDSKLHIFHENALFGQSWSMDDSEYQDYKAYEAVLYPLIGKPGKFDPITPIIKPALDSIPWIMVGGTLILVIGALVRAR